MKITILDCPPDAEEEITIRCRNVDANILTLVNALKAERSMLTVFSGEKLMQISPKDIYYFESVDDRVYAYLNKEVYEVRLKLYELEEQFCGADFFRASKSTIINLSQIDHIVPEFNGRMIAVMKNGEKLIINRQYVPELKRKLGLKG